MKIECKAGVDLIGKDEVLMFMFIVGCLLGRWLYGLTFTWLA